MHYFDYNATTPLHPEIKKHIPEWMELYANPSAMHSAGRQARERLESARTNILKNLGLEIYKLAFTSTGTEANFLAKVPNETPIHSNKPPLRTKRSVNRCHLFPSTPRHPAGQF